MNTSEIIQSSITVRLDIDHNDDIWSLNANVFICPTTRSSNYYVADAIKEAVEIKLAAAVKSALKEINKNRHIITDNGIENDLALFETSKGNQVESLKLLKAIIAKWRPSDFIDDWGQDDFHPVVDFGILFLDGVHYNRAYTLLNQFIEPMNNQLTDNDLRMFQILTDFISESKQFREYQHCSSITDFLISIVVPWTEGNVVGLSSP